MNTKPNLMMRLRDSLGFIAEIVKMDTMDLLAKIFQLASVLRMSIQLCSRLALRTAQAMAYALILTLHYVILSVNAMRLIIVAMLSVCAMQAVLADFAN